MNAVADPAAVAAASELADLVDANLRGQAAAKQSLELIDTDAAVPDELHEACARATRNWGEAGARGFHRIVQKALESRR
jgi:hypothetical protein